MGSFSSNLGPSSGIAKFSLSSGLIEFWMVRMKKIPSSNR